MAQTPKSPEAKGVKTLVQLSTIFAALLLAQPASSQKTTAVVTVAPSIPSSVPQFVDDETFMSAILNSTNFYRGEHNATAVEWNETLSGFATDYLNGDAVGADCKFAHSGGPYGENLALGYPNATASVEAWGNERAKYDFDNPGFTEDTGHFTQLVWKSTTDVGCGRRLCGERGWYLVCEYWPRGNIIGAFKDQVDRESAAGRVRSGWLGFAATGVALLMFA
ncbi:CAP domain-containing protein [Xylaria cf. heliscus]|nr:CAP domain-containing protein [Xylaria cf. heliscus]